MQVSARLKNFRMSAKKARLTADMVRGKSTNEAKSQLKYLPGKLSEPLFKLIESAIANASHNHGLDKNNLFIEKITIDDGPALQRWRPRAHGRAYPILKRSCHIEVVINEIEEGKNRRTVEKQEVKTVTYEELKKATKEAEKILAGQRKRLKKEEKKDEVRKGPDAKGGGALSKIFRRKSI